MDVLVPALRRTRGASVGDANRTLALLADRQDVALLAGLPIIKMTGYLLYHPSLTKTSGS